MPSAAKIATIGVVLLGGILTPAFLDAEKKYKKDLSEAFQKAGGIDEPQNCHTIVESSFYSPANREISLCNNDTILLKTYGRTGLSYSAVNLDAHTFAYAKTPTVNSYKKGTMEWEQLIEESDKTVLNSDGTYSGASIAVFNQLVDATCTYGDKVNQATAFKACQIQQKFDPEKQDAHFSTGIATVYKR